MSISTPHPNGHFYSPVTDPAELRREEPRIWPRVQPEIAGVHFDEIRHRFVLRELVAPHAKTFPFPTERPHEEYGYYEHNDQFGRVDARLLFCLLLAWRPRLFVEVGSGYSTMLASSVARQQLAGVMELTCVEPYPRRFVSEAVQGVGSLIPLPVQHVPLETFEQLEPGDVLFIDSSHVAKTGSDVLHLYFEVLPRLRPGVHVHVHDIFLPGDYPKSWAIEQNRSWNEQYLLRALLMFSSRFGVDFGCAWAMANIRGELAAALSLDESALYSAGSLWMEVR